MQNKQTVEETKADKIIETIVEDFSEKEAKALKREKVIFYGKRIAIGLGVVVLGALAIKALADNGEDIIEGVYEEIGD